jgi:hypothetical protein
MDDLLWLAILAGLVALTLAWARLCDTAHDRAEGGRR